MIIWTQRHNSFSGDNGTFSLRSSPKSFQGRSFINSSRQRRWNWGRPGIYQKHEGYFPHFLLSYAYLWCFLILVELGRAPTSLMGTMETLVVKIFKPHLFLLLNSEGSSLVLESQSKLTCPKSTASFNTDVILNIISYVNERHKTHTSDNSIELLTLHQVMLDSVPVHIVSSVACWLIWLNWMPFSIFLLSTICY